MAEEFVLRAMQSGDGQAINRLNEESPDSGAVSFYTQYLHDPYETLMALHPGTVGVVAEVPGVEGIVGMGLVTLSEGMVEGQLRPMAYLSGLKVHPNFRRRGLAKQLAQWRIETACKNMDGEGVIFANIQSGNVGSLKAAQKWANHVFEERVMGVVVTTTLKAPRSVAGAEVRPALTGELDAIAHGLNTFYQEYNLYTPESASDLLSWLDETAFGKRLHHYYVVVDRQNNVLAGLGLAVEGHLLQMHIRSMPPPLRIANMLLKLVPPGGPMRRLHVEKFWFAPGQEAKGQYLWEAVRWLAREHGTNMMFFFDTLSPFGQVIKTSRFVPQPRGIVVIQSSMSLDKNRPLVQYV